VHIGDTGGRLAGKTVHVPVLHGIRTGVEHFVHAERGSPATAECIANICITRAKKPSPMRSPRLAMTQRPTCTDQAKG